MPLELLQGKLLIGFVARGDTSPFRDRLREIVEGSGHGAFSVRIRPRGGIPVGVQLAVRAVQDSALATPGRREPVAFHWTVRPHVAADGDRSSPPA